LLRRCLAGIFMAEDLLRGHFLDNPEYIRKDRKI
jgi:hypothetical protein